MSRYDDLAEGRTIQDFLSELRADGGTTPADCAKRFLTSEAVHEGALELADTEGKQLSVVRTEFIQDVMARADAAGLA